jgi:hypothetical protein
MFHQLNFKREVKPVQIIPAIHALRHSFNVPVAPGLAIDRFMYSYLRAGETINLIDTGVAGCGNAIIDNIQSLSIQTRSPLLFLPIRTRIW